MPFPPGESNHFRSIDIDSTGLFIREKESGYNVPVRLHDIDVVDHGDYINIGCIRVSRAAWEYIVSKVKGRQGKTW